VHVRGGGRIVAFGHHADLAQPSLTTAPVIAADVIWDFFERHPRTGGDT
jgi:poly(3-hydroxybutyrate) depolymerase